MPMSWWSRSRRHRRFWPNGWPCERAAATAGLNSGLGAPSMTPRQHRTSPSAMSVPPNITRVSSCASSKASGGTNKAVRERGEIMSVIATIEQLEAIYGAPNDASTVKVADRVTPLYRVLIEKSPFAALATAGPEGLDCSPRGDLPVFVRIHDDKTLMMPDRRGNNRIDSLRNIVRDPRIALLFLIPGSGSTLRINGRAHVSAEPELLALFKVEGKMPRTVVVMTVDEIYF